MLFRIGGYMAIDDYSRVDADALPDFFIREAIERFKLVDVLNKPDQTRRLIVNSGCQRR